VFSAEFICIKELKSWQTAAKENREKEEERSTYHQAGLLEHYTQEKDASHVKQRAFISSFFSLAFANINACLIMNF